MARNFQVLVESAIRTLNTVLRKRKKKRKKISFGGCLQLSFGLVFKDIKILVLIRCLFTHLTSLGGRGSVALFYCNTETNKLFLKRTRQTIPSFVEITILLLYQEKQKKKNDCVLAKLH